MIPRFSLREIWNLGVQLPTQFRLFKFVFIINIAYLRNLRKVKKPSAIGTVYSFTASGNCTEPSLNLSCTLLLEHPDPLQTAERKQLVLSEEMPFRAEPPASHLAATLSLQISSTRRPSARRNVTVPTVPREFAVLLKGKLTI